MCLFLKKLNKNCEIIKKQTPASYTFLFRGKGGIELNSTPADGAGSHLIKQ